jgi:hypothetical protein
MVCGLTLLKRKSFGNLDQSAISSKWLLTNVGTICPPISGRPPPRRRPEQRGESKFPARLQEAPCQSGAAGTFIMSVVTVA